jgi:hypothetical protein
VEREYIQNIVLDRERRRICGCTYPVSHFFCYDLNARRTVRRHYLGAYPHQLAIDDEGRVWGTWGHSNHLFAYDQDRDAFHFSRAPLPGLERTDTGPLDGALNGGDGFLYFGTTQGALVQVDPQDPDAPEVRFLGKPLSKWRLPALTCGEDGLLYLVAGGEYDVHVVTYDRQTGRFDDLGRVVDEEKGLSCYMPHDLALTADGVAYVGETDHPERSGYLWECRL